ncbi:MAG: hypothetical protein FJ098_14230, partial [Deltaproteobacteria bacterium]|nr:hypothetical protein [Deltaproteobacteria bacterium]
MWTSACPEARRPSCGSWRTPALLLVLLAVSASCGMEEEPASLRLALDLGAGAARPDPGGSLRDGLGLFDLPAAGVFVALEVTAADMDPVLVEWPEEASDLAGFQGTVEIGMEVSPGAARRLDGLVFAWRDDRLRHYAPEEALTLDLAAGKAADVSLALREGDYGSVAGTAPSRTVAVEVVDQVTGVILARAEIGEARTFEVGFLPVGRPLYPVWDFGGGEREVATAL